MMNLLLIDIGNSRVKWALAQGDAWTDQGVTPLKGLPTLRKAFAGLPAPHRILISNVAGEKPAQQVRTLCATWSCTPEFVTPGAECCGVRNGYQQPAQLGSDRWAALIAAWHRTHAACIVVNCGTATTVDALSSSGEFLGGLILPGIEMMQHSLAEGTARLELTQGGWRAFPSNTADAIYSGAVQAIVGAIRQQHELLGAPSAPCLLCGGGADRIQPFLRLPLEKVDDLVLRGLQVIARNPQNG